MRRHIYQMYENKHEKAVDIKVDNDTINIICDLYDRGIDRKMIEMVFNEIETERKNDQMSDFDVYRL